MLYQRLRWPHWLAALVPFVLFLAILSSLGFFVQRLLAPHLAEMINNSQKLTAALLDHIFKQFNLQDVRLFGQTLDSDRAAATLLGVIQRAVGDNTLLALGGLIGAMAVCVLTLVLLAFMLFTGPHLARGTLWLVPPSLRPWICRLIKEIDPMLGDYLRGVFVIVSFTAVATYFVTAFLFHVPHPIFLALAVGLLELLPVVGPILSFLAFGLLAIPVAATIKIVLMDLYWESEASVAETSGQRRGAA